MCRKLIRQRQLGLVFVFFWFALGGWAHFAFTSTEMRIVPPWIPWPREVVLISGVFELVGAAGLILRHTRTLAGVGLVILTIAVTPANLYMLQKSAQFGIAPWLLVSRLVLQVLLLWLILWSTGIIPRSVVQREG